MALRDSIAEDLRKALKQGQATEVATLRLLLAGVKNAEIAQRKPADDGKVLEIVAGEVKRRKESIEAFRLGKREELAAKEEAELRVLMGYLPEQMSREEVLAVVRRAVGEVDAKGPADKGKVMSIVMPEVKGKADGREVSEMVVQILAAI